LQNRAQSELLLEFLIQVIHVFNMFLNKFLRLFVLFSLISLVSIVSSAKNNASTKIQWDLNDVTYVYPLPKNLSQNSLQPVTRYIPDKIISELPRLSIQYDKDTLNRMIYALAIRIDPEKSQIRTVWQPIAISTDHTLTTIDASLHSFHQLSQEEFKVLTLDLLKWKFKFSPNIKPRIPLNINPGFLNSDSTINDLAVQSLNTVFFKYLRPEKLIKVTAMVLRGADDMWAFLGFDLKNGLLQPIQIPRTESSTVQRFINQAVPFKFYENALIAPIQNDVEDSLVFLINKALAKPKLSEEDVMKALNISSRFENPLIYNSENLDCVSCHIAQSAREWTNNYNTNIARVAHGHNVYTNENYNLQNMSVEILNAGQIRGLGYFGKNLAISQRVIHDSALAADYLNK